ncbi:uncharacterized protein HMPREF1541_08910 [Cyphellophora europaea CBS 101466]|uniref:Uncharacterized protein n=1 Tax=Cyphellophora europaea (strain CBS 101466) TaxID=1220924 RepID=W2RJG1_CYPE1|nr:uncharacterized protein HMPREF1541_08910 [Cyphellophora europaea CBS 101466]ETN36632.1 hypothetical protein HMPREF1541_08910 [Cyphellophora europaea CBS 101466]
MAAALPFNVSEELAKLRHEKKNGQMPKLPPNATVQKRPIIHPAVASPYAGANVQKIVYVGSQTPFMSAVKRVKKLLNQVEKRVTQNVNMIKRGDREGMRRLAEATDKVAKDREEILVKASGRAMTKALNVGEWFRNKEKEMACIVEVRSGNVSVVDDIVEAEQSEDDADAQQPNEPTTIPEGGDTTMELLASTTKSSPDPTTHTVQDNNRDDNHGATEATAGKKARKRRKRKRPAYDPDDLPEQRLRWVKTVEVAISLKG